MNNQEKFLGKTIFHRLVNSVDSKEGKFFERSILLLIVISVITYSLSTVNTIPSFWTRVIDRIEMLLGIIFSIELLLRVIYTDIKRNYLLTIWGVIDLLALLPFYIAFGFDLRSLRVIRFLKVFRVFRLLKYNSAFNNLKRAFLICKEELIVYGVFSFIIIYLASVVIYHFENAVQPEAFSSVFTSMWWAVCTLTTVGYGDIYPITVGGRIFTFFILLIGLGMIAIPAGIISNALKDET